jgi:hypothetical protein
MIIPHPMQINDYSLVHAVRLRYECISSAAQLITFQNLLDTWLVAVSATQGFDVFDVVKIRAVEAWAAPTGGIGTSYVTVNFPGNQTGQLGDFRVQTANSMGLEPGYLYAAPNKMSQAAQWQVTSAAGAFSIQTTGGTIVDLHLSFRGGLTGFSPVACQNALVGATTGQEYLRGFDGQVAGASKWLPQGTPQVL